MRIFSLCNAISGSGTCLFIISIHFVFCFLLIASASWAFQWTHVCVCVCTFRSHTATTRILNTFFSSNKCLIYEWDSIQLLQCCVFKCSYICAAWKESGLVSFFGNFLLFPSLLYLFSFLSHILSRKPIGFQWISEIICQHNCMENAFWKTASICNAYKTTLQLVKPQMNWKL